MKNVYFVRHGETDLNVEDRYNAPDTPLNEKGREQARFLRERFTRIPIDIVVSSNHARALETARTVNKVLNVPFVESNLFVEKRFPSELTGKSPKEPDSIKYKEEYYKNVEKRDWHFRDEENFFDLHYRAIKALKLLEERSESNVLVVTHGTYVKVLVFTMLHGRDVRQKDFDNFHLLFMTKNTGITYCQFGADSGWKLLTWNDHVHLG